MASILHADEMRINGSESSQNIQFVARNARFVAVYEGESSDET